MGTRHTRVVNVINQRFFKLMYLGHKAAKNLLMMIYRVQWMFKWAAFVKKSNEKRQIHVNVISMLYKNAKQIPRRSMNSLLNQLKSIMKKLILPLFSVRPLKINRHR